MWNWQELWPKLKAKFDQSPLTHRDNAQRQFIPVEWYEHRANIVAGDHYKKEIRDFEVTDKFVKVIVRVYIGETFRDGPGFAAVDTNGTNNAVDRAFAEACRNAFDSFEMGWEDLGIYEKKGIRGKHEEVICRKCTQPIPADEWARMRRFPKLKVPYHEACAPTHLLKE